MQLTKQINTLWLQLILTINAAYESKGKDADVLGDYAHNGIDLRNLVKTETDNERQHRRGTIVPGFKPPISAETAAKVILLNNVVDGAQRSAMIPATDFLVLRKTACEGMVLGWLIRGHMSKAFAMAVKELNYSEIMKA